MMEEALFMSETVSVALITLVAGLIGSCIGALSTYQVAKFQSSAEASERLRNERHVAYAELMSAYINFSSSMAKTAAPPISPISEREYALYSEFNAACSKAGLLATKPTLLRINELLLAMSEYGRTMVLPDNINDLYSAAVDAMRAELLSTEKQPGIYRFFK